MSRIDKQTEAMGTGKSHGKLTGQAVQHRSWLRRNLVNRMFRLGNAIQAQTQQLLALNSDLSVLHYRILLRLQQAGAQNVQGISELLGANRSMISRVLPQLRDRGWIEMVEHESDRRQLIIQLTKAGEGVLDDHRPPVDSRFEALHAAFTETELERLLEYLDRLDAVTMRPAQDFDVNTLEEPLEEPYD